MSNILQYLLQNYLLVGASSEKGVDLDDDARSTLLDVSIFSLPCFAFQDQDPKVRSKNSFILQDMHLGQNERCP